MKPVGKLRAIVVTGMIFALPDHALAFDLTGAWATSAAQCGKVFARKGRANQLTFSNFSGVYGGGFIAEADRLRGKFENCKIKSRKDDGKDLNIIVGCASGIMVSNVQFFLKVVDDDTITRDFPGIEGMQVSYHRCKL
ncbi:hypothetical protein [Bradyrhizobium tropiciagri]|uniref:hypothetical protein n=1 Tax=Bradyrhizobium tropiciagri TaxID=312253 RepID=UPI0020125A8C|nr:hypothetical protein [Bradyrhizobium tropiciagri]